MLSTLAISGIRLGRETVTFTITKGLYAYYWSPQGSHSQHFMCYNIYLSE